MRQTYKIHFAQDTTTVCFVFDCLSIPLTVVGLSGTLEQFRPNCISPNSRQFLRFIQEIAHLQFIDRLVESLKNNEVVLEKRVRFVGRVGNFESARLSCV